MKNRIRELRKQLGITMKQLGNEVGLAENVISRYETGKREPDNDSLVKLSKFFGVSVGYLIGAEEKETQPEIIEDNQQGDAMFQLQERDARNGLSMMELTDTEQHLIETFRALSSQGQEYILNQITIASQVYTKNASVPVAGTEAG